MPKRKVTRRAARGEGKVGEKPEPKRETIAIQVDKDIGRMVRTIAAHDGVSQAEVVRPALIAYVPAQMARVQAEIEEEMKPHQSAG